MQFNICGQTAFDDGLLWARFGFFAVSFSVGDLGGAERLIGSPYNGDPVLPTQLQIRASCDLCSMRDGKSESENEKDCATFHVDVITDFKPASVNLDGASWGLYN